MCALFTQHTYTSKAFVFRFKLWAAQRETNSNPSKRERQSNREISVYNTSNLASNRARHI